MIERENTPMTTSSDVIAGLELALASADAMIERLQGERAILRDSVIEALQLAHDHMRLYLPHYTEKHNVFDTVTRALKSQLAAPDPRDEVIRLSRETLAGIVSADYRKWEELANAEEFVRWAKSRANHALAAIDKVMKEGK